MIPPYFFIIAGVLVCSIALYYILISFKKDSGVLSDRAETLYKDKTSVNMGKIAANHQAKVATARTDLNNSLVAETVSQVNLDQAPKRAREIHDKTEATHQMDMNILSKALEMNLDSPTYIAVQQKQHFNRLDLEKEWVLIEQKLKGAFIYAEKERQYLQLHKDMIFKLYEERKQLESGNEIAKENKLKFLDNWIEKEERIFNERTGLLQTPAQKNLGGSNKDSDFPGDIR